MIMKSTPLTSIFLENTLPQKFIWNPEYNNYCFINRTYIYIQYRSKLWDHLLASLPNVVAANSPRWDENRNRGKDEATESCGELDAAMSR